jgi:5-methylcytosine-specific restriction endonuclease McrA
LACDCEISRVITDGPSVIIDIGRTTRTVSDKLWRALVARDRHCQGPDCDRPPAFCEAHHIHYWTRGGPTNLANLKLLCWQHHRQQHAHDDEPRAGLGPRPEPAPFEMPAANFGDARFGTFGRAVMCGSA